MRIHKRLIDIDARRVAFGDRALRALAAAIPRCARDADERALRQLMRIQVPDSVIIEIVLRT